jgi:peptide/nickel transport system substrate-binding protein
MRRKLFRAAAPALALSLSLGLACQTRPAGTPSDNANRAAAKPPGERIVGGRGGNLSYRLSAAPKTFNYVVGADEPTNLVAFFLLASRLVEFDHDRQDYAPALAESWRRSDDMRSVEITLRDGLKFSDGQPLTSEDVAFTLRALYDPKVNSPIYSHSMMIGDKPFEAKVADARRLTIVFPEPVLVPENYLSNLGVLPRHALEPELQKGAFDKAYGITADPKSVVVSGKFAVEASQPGERVVLRRNPNYWKKDSAGNQLPYLDTLTLEVIGDENNAVARLNQGALHVYDRLRPADFAALRGGTAGALAYDLGPGLYSDVFWFNMNPGKRADGRPLVDPAKLAWFSDVRFRRAVSHAVDRESIARNVWLGLATPLHGFVTPGNRAWFAADLPRHEYDLEKARALLRDAGFQTRGTAEAPELYDAKNNRVAFTILAPAGTKTRVDSAAVVQEDLRRLGMQVAVAPVENAQVNERVNQTFDYEAVFFGTSVTEPDPSSYVDVLRSVSPQHFWNPKQTSPATDWERRVDELAEAQARETDHERRRQLFREIQLIMAEQLPIIPVASRHIPVAASPRVGNYRPSTLPPFSLWNAEELFVKQ